MKNFLLVGILLALSQCGYRWNVKTMSDTEQTGGKKEGVFFNADVLTSGPPVYTSIDSLVSLPRPEAHMQRCVEETRTYIISGNIFFWTMEPDKDVHIAIRSGKAKMICEIPSPSETGNSLVADQILKARKSFFKYSRSWHRMQPGIYQVTGVLFYDKRHIEIGANKNHVELHPVLEFKKL